MALVTACGGGSESSGRTGTESTSSGTTGDIGGAGAGGAAGAGATGGGGGKGGEGGSVTPACEGKTGQSGDSTITLPFDGKDREAQIHVPAQYDPTQATMLVLNFHGFLSNAAQQAEVSKMSAASDERGFIVAYPSGSDASWNGGACCGIASSQGVDDVGFVSALIDEVSKAYCVDPKRVFATGMSNGGFLSNRLGCELSDRIAAIAPVAGVLGIAAEECQPARKMPVIHFHGTSDLLVPYDGNAFLGYIAVEDSVGRWKDIDGCGPSNEVVFDTGDSQCVSANGCADGSEVILCTVDGGGHQWPGGEPFTGGGHTSTDLDATSTMLDFFAKHPMP